MNDPETEPTVTAGDPGGGPREPEEQLQREAAGGSNKQNQRAKQAVDEDPVTEETEAQEPDEEYYEEFDSRRYQEDLNREQAEYKRLVREAEVAPPEGPRLPPGVGISEVELQGLAQSAASAVTGGDVGYSDDPVERAQARFEWEQERAKGLKRFESQVSVKLASAYAQGLDSATDRATARAYFWRGFVLLLVVLAVVAMPIIAIVVDLEPTDFGTYIAPVTGIAGTVVGYWFGQAGREQSQPNRPPT